MKILRFVGALVLCLVALQIPVSSIHAAAGRYFVYIGTYTGPQSKGIYLYQLDSASGKLTALGLAGEIANPSFLTLHPNGRFLYAASEVGSFNGERAGAVGAFSIDAKTGLLTLLNKVSSRGGGPCHVVVDRTGRNLLVANYGGGSVAVLPIGEDGRLSEASAFIQHKGSSVNPSRQKEPHAHCVTLSPDNRFLMVSDLGLDQIVIYRFEASGGQLMPGDPPFAKVNPGAGPRHFTFHPGGSFGYVINEIQSTLTAFAYDAVKGALTEIQSVSTLPQGFAGDNSTAEVELLPSGKVLYGSNRGRDSIAAFSVDASGKLTPLEETPSGGKVPRNFAIDPSGSFLLAANQKSDNVVVFRIDAKSGRLTPTGEKVDVASPVCIKFLAVK